LTQAYTNGKEWNHPPWGEKSCNAGMANQT
jgi:hypothetical protein